MCTLILHQHHISKQAALRRAGLCFIQVNYSCAALHANGRSPYCCCRYFNNYGFVYHHQILSPAMLFFVQAKLKPVILDLTL